MYSFVSIRVISWPKTLPAAEGGLAKKSVFIRAIRGLPSVFFVPFCVISWPKKSSCRLL